MTQPFQMTVPDFCVVVLIGVSGSGKSTFAEQHFKRSEVLSSDAFRLMVSDNENDQSATKDAFDALHHVANIRLRGRRTVVVDATNVQSEARKPLLELAQRHDCLAVAIVLDVSERVCQTRNRERADRQFGPHVIGNQARQLRQSLRSLRREGFRTIFTLDESQIARAEVQRTPLWTDRRAEKGPFDLIGDVHGCYDELLDLLGKLGYAPGEDGGAWRHPEGRRAVFLGDLVDRGPKVVETLTLARAMVEVGAAFCVPGNHDTKLVRALKGSQVSTAHGLAETLEQFEALPEEEREKFKAQTIAFIEGLVSHLWLDEGRLCAAHAGMKEEYIGRASGRVREFALYGETSGETDERGLPIRYPWAQDYRGAVSIIYGHTPIADSEWLNNTINLDTGCAFGGKLSALRWPEREIVQVAARAVYHEWVQRVSVISRTAEEASAAGADDVSDATSTVAEVAPHESGDPEVGAGSAVSAQWEHDSLLRAEDVLGKRLIQTRLMRTVTIPAENSAAALEVMSRFAVEPRWLVTLPPTMSPCETATEGEYLEHPLQAFEYYRGQGVANVVCQRKHMGSRAILVICKDAETARLRFGAEQGELGNCFTRTGRQFFDGETHAAFLAEASAAMERSGLWETLDTDWVCLDCEIMPWNAKAQSLVRDQYAPVGAAARLSLSAAIEATDRAAARGVPVQEVAESLRLRLSDVERYTAAYLKYCWPVQGLGQLKTAPFHLLATEGRTYFDRAHDWHLTTLARLASSSTLFMETETRPVDIGDPQSIAQAVEWWLALTNAGGEGMVVKPADFEAHGPRGLVQPAIKVRGREYLRIIYGPEYTEPANIERLRARRLGTKRRLALREFALGVEALERFVRKEPLRRVHECVFGVLALESEPVDPRL